jgi:hypothetical protein
LNEYVEPVTTYGVGNEVAMLDDVRKLTGTVFDRIDQPGDTPGTTNS